MTSSSARRHLDLEGSYNVRDLGGYPTSDGRRTRWQTFLRADSLHRLPPGSKATLLDYGVRTVIDLRRGREMDEATNVFAASSQVAYHRHNLAGDGPVTAIPGAIGDERPYDRIVRGYSRILDDRQPAIRRTLATLAAPGAHAAVFHCMAGKDRTGIISALLLGIARVPAEIIAEDYALSARHLFPNSPLEFTPESRAYYGTWENYQADACPPEAMRSVLGHLDDRYGGVEAYVRAIGLTQEEIESIRTAFVE